MKRAALYLRVSTLDQHPETQLHDLRALAAQRGFDIVREYTDRISGTRAKRPGLGELLHLLEQHAKHVVSLLGRRVPNGGKGGSATSFESSVRRDSADQGQSPFAGKQSLIGFWPKGARNERTKEYLTVQQEGT